MVLVYTSIARVSWGMMISSETFFEGASNECLFGDRNLIVI